MRRGALAAEAAADVAVVVVFVVIGRSAHARGLTVGGVASTAWPFLVGLGAGWAVLVARRARPASAWAGAAACGATVAVGMALRVVAGQGTAAAFVLVALAFLGAAMEGWRAVLAASRRRLRGRPAP